MTFCCSAGKEYTVLYTDKDSVQLQMETAITERHRQLKFQWNAQTDLKLSFLQLLLSVTSSPHELCLLGFKFPSRGKIDINKKRLEHGLLHRAVLTYKVFVEWEIS